VLAEGERQPNFGWKPWACRALPSAQSPVVAHRFDSLDPDLGIIPGWR
jgi:hypothetical protein